VNVDPLVGALAALGMDASSHRALLVLPLVEVAWADGEVQASERELLLRLAEERLAIGPEGGLLLEDWLRYAPTEGYFARGRDTLRTLARASTEGFEPRVLDDVGALAVEVAEAAGGFLGFGRVSREETAAIDRLRAHLRDAAQAPADLPVADREQVRAHYTTTLHTDALTGPMSGLSARGVVSLGGKSVAVTRDGVVLGSAPDAVPVPGAEPHHCKVFERARKFYVADLSAGGTRVDGERVGERRLLGGETLSLGPATVVFKMMRRDSSA
jgi:hypothetical protein